MAKAKPPIKKTDEVILPEARITKQQRALRILNRMNSDLAVLLDGLCSAFDAKSYDKLDAAQKDIASVTAALTKAIKP